MGRGEGRERKGVGRGRGEWLTVTEGGGGGLLLHPNPKAPKAQPLNPKAPCTPALHLCLPSCLLGPPQFQVCEPGGWVVEVRVISQVMKGDCFYVASQFAGVPDGPTASKLRVSMKVGGGGRTGWLHPRCVCPWRWGGAAGHASHLHVSMVYRTCMCPWCTAPRCAYEAMMHHPCMCPWCTAPACAHGVPHKFT